MRHFFSLPLSKVFICLSVILITGTSFSNAQDRYWVYLKDKSGTSFDPYSYFDQKAIDRRKTHCLSLQDSTDYPLNRDYVLKIKGSALSLIFESRWFNAALITATEDQINHIRNFSFVRKIESSIQLDPLILSAMDDDLSEKDLNILIGQTASLESQEFIKNNLDGKGVRIAIFDAGFPGVDKHPAFEHIRSANRIIKTYDFVRKQDHVYDYNGHGTAVMSCIGGKFNDINVGLATGSEFLLARTERAKMEPFSEEENWLAAMEWADKNGADIINSSLGYTFHRYFQEDMDGKKSFVSRAANMAAAKGILVVNAAGNEGSGSWKFLGTPGDADSVLTVGGIHPSTGYHTTFSSYGPTRDKRRKPNVSAYGHVIAAKKRGYDETQGTSFSSPLVAGFAACAMQSRSGIKNMELFKEIEKSSTLYPYYDYAHGHGLPQASYFTAGKDSVIPTFDFNSEGGLFSVNIRDEFLNEGQEMFYYHIENKSGYLDKYFVLRVEQKNVLELPIASFSPGQTIRMHYKGYTYSFTF